MTELTWNGTILQYGLKKRLVTGLVLLTAIFVFFAFFFQYIQHRDGVVLNDALLNRIPAVNVSIPLIVFIWGTSLLMIVRAATNPRIFLNFLWTFIFLSITRCITIYVTRLDPPLHLIPLVDPISNAFYGKHFITKDLFFSGHTATMFIIFLCLERKTDRLVALISTIAVAILMLVQHVHYTIDVVFAPPFAYLCYYMGVKCAGTKKLKCLP